jgi:hypothetical protein
VIAAKIFSKPAAESSFFFLKNSDKKSEFQKKQKVTLDS